MYGVYALLNYSDWHTQHTENSNKTVETKHASNLTFFPIL